MVEENIKVKVIPVLHGALRHEDILVSGSTDPRINNVGD
jgi:hypothetical protein